MRTYEDTFERVMIKKANAEKAIRARNKKIVFTATSFSCLCICIMASLAINKSFITADGNKPVESGVSQKISKEEFTVSSTVADVPEPDIVTETSTQKKEDVTNPSESKVTTVKIKEDVTKPSQNNVPSTSYNTQKTEPISGTTKPYPQIVVTNPSGGVEIPDWKKEELERWRKYHLNYAMSALSDEEKSKIDIDKSYVDGGYSKPEIPGSEYLIIHLEGDTFCYEVGIDSGHSEVDYITRFNK
ncbi:MAG: hypothetical protein IJZ57_08895 [Clostridia bacterium]|nr:hypothetical protein [Clostridia bacterium]